MANITASMVKDLRDKTGAGMMDCKKALNEVQGDLEKAVDWLRTKGLSAAAKKAGRVAAEGLIGAVVAGTKGVVVEVNSETDFVARNEAFQTFVRNATELALGAESARAGDDRTGRGDRVGHRGGVRRHRRTRHRAAVGGHSDRHRAAGAWCAACGGGGRRRHADQYHR